LRAIKPPFTKQISNLGLDDSNPRQTVSGLLRSVAAIVADGVNDFGGLDVRAGSGMIGTADVKATSVERFGDFRAGWPAAPGENR
jgi:hypothetical protein